MTQLVHTSARRVGRLLEREGLLERDIEQLDLGDVLDDGYPIADLVGHSIFYRMAVSPHRGRRVFKLQTLPTFDEEGWATGSPGNVAEFSLQAGVATKACQSDKLEGLYQYICRPPVSEKRLFLTTLGDIGYTLKSPYRDGRRSAESWCPDQSRVFSMRRVFGNSRRWTSMPFYARPVSEGMNRNRYGWAGSASG